MCDESLHEHLHAARALAFTRFSNPPGCTKHCCLDQLNTVSQSASSTSRLTFSCRPFSS